MSDWKTKISQYDESLQADDSKSKALRADNAQRVINPGGLTIPISKFDNGNVIEVEEEPEDWEEMRAYAEGLNISLAGRSMRHAFVNEFLTDFRGIEAATRIGAQGPANLWRRLQKCSYTQKLIQLKLERWEAKSIISRNVIIAKYWQEANDYEYGTAQSRLAATKLLADMLGYESDKFDRDAVAAQEALKEPLSSAEFAAMKAALDDEY